MCERAAILIANGDRPLRVHLCRPDGDDHVLTAGSIE